MGKNKDWLDSALEPLRNPPPSTDWPSPEVIGRRAAARRRRRTVELASGTTAVLATVLVIALVAFPGTGRSPGDRQPPALTSGTQAVPGLYGSVQLLASAVEEAPAGPGVAAELSADEQAFALRLMRLELASAGNGNVLLSPMSADVDLSILELGSAGATRSEVAKALQSLKMSAPEEAAAWREFLTGERSSESPGELQLANSIWVAKYLNVQAGFLHAEAGAFGNDTYKVDFGSSSATKAINGWVDHETAGRISQLFTPGEIPPYADLVLANALHFHAAWASRVKFVDMHDEPFYSASGARISVPTMSTPEPAQLGYASNASYEAVQIPYTNGRFAALLIEPTPGSMRSFLDGLTVEGLSTITSSLAIQPVAVTMPDLDLSARPVLNGPLQALGMAAAFQSADLTPILGHAGGPQALAVVQQAVTLHVNEWGTDAAAATGAVAVPSSAFVGTRAVFDHPYVFLLRDTKTGAVLFSSVVNNPVAS